MNRLLLGGLAAMVLPGCAAALPTPPDPQGTSMHSAPADIRAETLPNGMKVILERNTSAPVVAMQMWVEVGSADEGPDEQGLAHLHEHMLFKGTARRGVGVIASDVEGAGGNINAWTSDDQTVYHLVVPAREFDMGLDILTDAVQHSAFDGEELRKEIEVVIEEIRRSKDSPDRSIYEALFQEVYRVHPYRNNTLGTEESVASVTREKILDFYRRWYVPANMTLVLVGDFDPETARAKIAAATRDFAERPVPGRTTRVEEPVQREFRARLLEGPYQKTYLEIAYHIPGAKDPRVPALDALAGVLGQGESSRLYRSVQDELQLVDSITAGSYTPRDTGVFMVGAVLDEARVEPTLKAVLAQMDRLRREPPTLEELERVKINIESDRIYDKETMEGQALKLGYYSQLLGDVRMEKEYIRRVLALTPQDIQEQAEALFRPEAMTIALMVQPGQAAGWSRERLEAIVRADRAEPLAAEAIAEKTEDADGILRARLTNGATILIQRVDSVPIVNVRAAFLGGVLFENPPTNGIHGLLADMLTRGTESLDAQGIAGEIESIAGEIEGFSGRNAMGLSSTFISRFHERGLDLFFEVLRNPAFDPKELEKSRRETLAAIARQLDSPARIAFQEFGRQLYGEHPYALDPLGSEEGVKSVTVEALRDRYEAVFRPDNLVLVVVGDVQPDSLLKELAARLADWPPGYVRQPVAEPRFPTEVRRKAIVQDKNQTHILIGFPGVRLNEGKDRRALEILTSILGGQGGRLFLELRDRQSLAYNVTAMMQEGLVPGYFAVYLACAPDKVEQARAGLLAELERVLQGSLTDEEVDRAKRYLMGSHDIARQSGGSLATSLAFDELYGLGYRDSALYPEQIRSIARHDVEAVARRIIQLNRHVLTVLGPEADAAESVPTPGGKAARTGR